MDVSTVFNNGGIYEGLLLGYLNEAWKDFDDNGFIIKCIDLFKFAPRDKISQISLVIKRSYPQYWPRVEKLLVLV